MGSADAGFQRLEQVFHDLQMVLRKAGGLTSLRLVRTPDGAKFVGRRAVYRMGNGDVIPEDLLGCICGFNHADGDRYNIEFEVESLVTGEQLGKVTGRRAAVHLIEATIQATISEDSRCQPFMSKSD